MFNGNKRAPLGIQRTVCFLLKLLQRVRLQFAGNDGRINISSGTFTVISFSRHSEVCVLDTTASAQQLQYLPKLISM